MAEIAPSAASTSQKPPSVPGQASASIPLTATKTEKTWQEELAKVCRQQTLSSPVYNIVSDRRGGRTAWSATVTIQNQNIAARYWYDGQHLNEAKEDAAQVGVNKLRAPSGPSE